MLDITDPQMIFQMKIAQVLSVTVIFIIPALLFASLLNENGLRILNIHKVPMIYASLLAALAMMASTPLINLMGTINNAIQLPEAFSGIELWMKTSEENLKKLTEAFLSDPSFEGLLLNLFIVAFLAALAEELFFRGLLQTHFLKAVNNAHVAIWVSAFLFSFVHMQFYGFIPRMVMGALLGYMYHWGRSLWYPIVAHFANNATAVIVNYYIIQGTIPKQSETLGSNEGDWLFILISLAIVPFLILKFYQSTKPVESTIGI